MAESIDGTIRRVVHQARTFDGGNFVIAKIDGHQTVMGDLDDPREGETYRFFGEWHAARPPYTGKDFKFTSCEVIVDMSADGVAQYLKNYIDGLGVVKAAAIVEHFGVDTLSVLRESPERASEVPRITPEIVEGIRAHFDNVAASDPATEAKLLDLFRSAKFPRRVVKHLMRAYRGSAADRVMGNPYILLGFRGVGWKTVDAFALTVAKYDPSGVERHMGAIKEAFEQIANDGHTCGTMESVNKIAGGLLGMAAKGQAWSALAAAGVVKAHARADGEAERYVALSRYADAEREVARRVVMLLEDGPPLPIGVDVEGLAEEQDDAMEVIKPNGLAILTGAPGTGKAQPLDAIIYTPTGPKRMGDIAIGDQVIGSNGCPCRVTGVFPQGYREVFRITFDDGAQVECCEDHLWKVGTRGRRYYNNKHIVLSTKKIMKRFLESQLVPYRRSRCRTPYYFPMVEPVEFSASELPIDPYLLGMLLGDGKIGNAGVAFCSIDQELIDSVGRLMPAGMEVVPRGNGKDYRLSSGPKSRRNPLRRILNDLGLREAKSHTKFIPDIYKFSNIQDRLAILSGLLDTDGSADRSAVEYSTSSRQLALDVQFLVESLGGKAKIKSRIPVYTYLGEKKEGKISYRMSLSIPNQFKPFRLSRKAIKNTSRVNRHPVRTIESIECIGIKDVQCISVDAPDHLYVTDHFVVTHNTHVTAKVVSAILKSGVPADSVLLVSPTGKAARRSAELLFEHGVRGVTCSTIHRALSPTPGMADPGAHKEDAKLDRGREEFGFARNEHNPIPASHIVVDELSMCDARLAASLLRAIKPGTRVLFVGDENQLPSVGPGSVLRDLMAAGIPSFTLREIRRSSSAGTVVHACHAIRDGIVPTPADCVDLAEHKNWVHVEVEDGVDIANTIVNLIASVKTFDPLWGVQVVTPQKTRHPFATGALNHRLACLLNPVAREAVEAADADVPESSISPPYYIGDKVIRTENGFAKEMMTREAYEAAREAGEPWAAGPFKKGWTFRGVDYLLIDSPIVNGDMGTVLDVVRVGGIGHQVVVALKAPERLVRLPQGDAKLMQAYALTAHKMQGSGAPMVIIPVHNSVYAGLFTREWIYTAISRTQTLCVTVGQFSAIEAAVGRKTVDKRRTRLAELLRAELAERAEARRVAMLDGEIEEAGLGEGLRMPGCELVTINDEGSDRE